MQNWTYFNMTCGSISMKEIEVWELCVYCILMRGGGSNAHRDGWIKKTGESLHLFFQFQGGVFLHHFIRIFAMIFKNLCHCAQLHFERRKLKVHLKKNWEVVCLSGSTIEAQVDSSWLQSEVDLVHLLHTCLHFMQDMKNRPSVRPTLTLHIKSQHVLQQLFSAYIDMKNISQNCSQDYYLPLF